MFHHNFLIGLHLTNGLTHHGIRTEPERQTHNEADRHLTHNLIHALQAFLVTFENLDIVIQETQEAQPDGGDNHEQQIDVTHTTQQNHRHQDRDDDDDTTHRRHAFLRHAKGVDGRIALCLKDLTTLHELDEVLAKPSGNDQRQNQRDE